MKLRPSLLLLYLVAGLASSALAGIIGMLLTAAALEGPVTALLAIVFAANAALIGIKWSGATAVILGGMLSMLARSHPWCRRRWAWMLTGLAAGLVHYVLPWPEIAVSVARDPRLQKELLPIVFALSGIGAALTFRATMRLGALFLSDEDEA